MTQAETECCLRHSPSLSLIASIWSVVNPLARALQENAVAGTGGGVGGAKSASPAPCPDGKLLFTLQNLAQSVVPAKASPDLFSP